MNKIKCDNNNDEEPLKNIMVIYIYIKEKKIFSEI
jgi:hypothetical protein